AAQRHRAHGQGRASRRGRRPTDGRCRPRRGVSEPMKTSLARRPWISAGLLAAVLVAGCGGKPGKDPSNAGELVTMEDVDDRLADKVEGDRVRVEYSSQDPMKGATEPLVTIVE